MDNYGELVPLGGGDPIPLLAENARLLGAAKPATSSCDSRTSRGSTAS